MEYAWDNIEKELVSDGYQYWKPGQPDNSDENCIEMMSGNGKWNNLDCNTNRFVLCEKCETCTPTTKIPTATLASTLKTDSASEFSTKPHDNGTENYNSTASNTEAATTPSVLGANHLEHHNEDPKTIDDNHDENSNLSHSISAIEELAYSNEHKDASTPTETVDSQQITEPTKEAEKSNVDQMEVKMEENTDYYYNEDPIDKETDTYDESETHESTTTIELKMIDNSNVESSDDLKMNMLDEDPDNKSAIHQNTMNPKVDVSNDNDVEVDNFDHDESKMQSKMDATDIEETSYVGSKITTVMNMEITNGETTDQTPPEANLVDNIRISDVLEPETVDILSTSEPLFTQELIGAEVTENENSGENSDIMKLVESIIEDMINNTKSNRNGEETKDIRNLVEISQKDNTDDYKNLEIEEESTNSDSITNMEDDMRNEKLLGKNEPEKTEDFEITEEVQEPTTLNESTNMEEGIKMDEAHTTIEISADKNQSTTMENINENKQLTTSVEELVTMKNHMAQKEPVNSNTINDMEEIIDNDDTFTTEYPEYTNKVLNDEEVMDVYDTEDKHSRVEELQTTEEARVSEEMMFNKELSHTENIKQATDAERIEEYRFSETTLTVDEPVKMEEVTISDENMDIDLVTNSEHLITSDAYSYTEHVTNQEQLIPSGNEIATKNGHLVPFDDYSDTELVTNIEHLIPSDDYSDNKLVTNYEELIPSDDYLDTELRYEEEKMTNTNDHVNTEKYFEIEEVMTTISPLYIEEATIEPLITIVREIDDKESRVTSTNMKEEQSTKMVLDYESTETPIGAEEQTIKEDSTNDNEDMNMDKGDFQFEDNPIVVEDIVTNTGDHVKTEKYSVIEEVMTTISSMYLEEQTIEPLATTISSMYLGEQTIEPLATIGREINVKESLVPSMNMKEDESTDIVLDSENTEMPIGIEEMTIGEGSMNDYEGINMEIEDFLEEEHTMIEKEEMMKETLEAAYDYMFKDYPIESEEKVTNTDKHVSTDKYLEIEEDITTINPLYVEVPTIEPLVTIREGIDDKDALVPSTKMKEEQSTEMVFDSENTEKPIVTENHAIVEENMNNIEDMSMNTGDFLDEEQMMDPVLSSENTVSPIDTKEPKFREDSMNDNKDMNMKNEEFLGEEQIMIEKEEIRKQTSEVAYDMFEDYPIENLVGETLDTTTVDESFDTATENLAGKRLETAIVDETLETTTTGDKTLYTTNIDETLDTTTINLVDESIDTTKENLVDEKLDTATRNLVDEGFDATNVDESLDTTNENLKNERLDTTTENLVDESPETATENIVDERLGTTTDNLVDESLDTTNEILVVESLDITTVNESLETKTENFLDESLYTTTVDESLDITTENLVDESLETTIVDESLDTKTVYETPYSLADESLDATTVYKSLDTGTENLIDESLDTTTENLIDGSLDTKTEYLLSDIVNAISDGVTGTTGSNTTKIPEYATEGISYETHSDTEESPSNLGQSHNNEFANVSDQQTSTSKTDFNVVTLNSTTETEYNNESINLEHQKSTNEFLEEVSEKLDEEFTWDNELLTDSLDYFSSETMPDHTEMSEGYPQYSETTMSNQLENISESEYTDVEDDMFDETLMYDSASFTDDSESFADDSESYDDKSESYDDNSESFADNSESFADSPLSMEENNKSAMENLKNGDNIETETLKQQFVNEMITEETSQIEVKSTSDNLLISNPTSAAIVQESTTSKGIYEYIRFALFFNLNIQNHFGAVLLAFAKGQ